MKSIIKRAPRLTTPNTATRTSVPCVPVGTPGDTPRCGVYYLSKDDYNHGDNCECGCQNDFVEVSPSQLSDITTSVLRRYPDIAVGDIVRLEFCADIIDGKTEWERNNGLFFVGKNSDGSRTIIEPYYGITDYGSIPLCFDVVDFCPNYWHYDGDGVQRVRDNTIIPFNIANYKDQLVSNCRYGICPGLDYPNKVIWTTFSTENDQEYTIVLDMDPSDE